MPQSFNYSGHSSVLDDELEDMLLPLSLMQLVLLQPKYRIARGSVKQNNIFSHGLCLVGFACVTIINIFRLLPSNSTKEIHLAGFLVVVTYLDALMYITFCVLLCILNARQIKTSVLLILKMQQAYRTIAVGNSGELKKQRNRTWLYMISIICVYIFFLEGNRQFGLLHTLYALYVISLLYFDGNIVLATRIINFLVYEVKLWLEELRRFDEASAETNHVQLMKHLDNITRRKEALFKAWLDITEVFNLCGKIFHLPVSVTYVGILTKKTVSAYFKTNKPF